MPTSAIRVRAAARVPSSPPGGGSTVPRHRAALAVAARELGGDGRTEVGLRDQRARQRASYWITWFSVTKSGDVQNGPKTDWRPGDDPGREDAPLPRPPPSKHHHAPGARGLGGAAQGTALRARLLRRLPAVAPPAGGLPRLAQSDFGAGLGRSGRTAQAALDEIYQGVLDRGARQKPYSNPRA